MRYLILTILILTSLYFKFVDLGVTPAGLNVDEAIYGIDAKSILTTGRDSWSHLFPLTLQSFGDYKPAGLAYTLIPFVATLGLNTLAVRLPSALFMLGVAIVTYFILNLLLRHRAQAIILTLLFATQPWVFGISRLFFETGPGLFFLSLGIYACLSYLSGRRRILDLILFTLGFAIAGYYYAVLRYLALGLIALFLLIEFPRYTKNIKYALFSFLLLALPWLFLTLSPIGFRRLGQESALHRFGYALVIDENRQFCYLSFNKNPTLTKLCYFFWNKPFEQLNNIARTYVDQLGVNYLFLDSSEEYIVPTPYGAYYYYLTPFYLLGLVILFSRVIRSPHSSKSEWFVLLGYLLVNLPVAAAGAVSIHRNIVGLYFAYLICGYGLAWVWEWLTSYKRIAFMSAGAFAIVTVFYHAQFIIYYFNVYAKTLSELWHPDTQAVYTFASSKQDKYNQIIDNTYMGPLFAAFYGGVSVQEFQGGRRGVPSEYGWIHMRSAGKYQYGGPSLTSLLCQKVTNPTVSLKTLVITKPDADFHPFALFSTTSFNGVHTLTEIYDVDDLYLHLPPGFKAGCTHP